MRSSAALVTVALGLAACGGEDIGFVGPSVEELRAVGAALAAPTGEVTAETLEWAVGTGEDAFAFVSTMQALLAVHPAVLPAEGGTEETADGLTERHAALALGGTHAAVYVRFSCPGPDLAAPDVAFRYGEARIESDDLSEDGALGGGEGRFALFFDACVVGRDTLLGEAYGLWQSEEARWILMLDAETRGDDGAEHPLVADLVWRGDGTGLLLERPGVGTYALLLRFDAGLAAAELRGANGSFGCNLSSDAGAVRCTGPDGQVLTP